MIIDCEYAVADNADYDDCDGGDDAEKINECEWHLACPLIELKSDGGMYLGAKLARLHSGLSGDVLWRSYPSPALPVGLDLLQRQT